MRKWITVGFIACFALLIIFYTKDMVNIDHDDSQNQIVNHDINNIEIDSPQKIDEEENDNPALELLSMGKMDGIDIGLGADGKEIIEQLGEPVYQENFLGGLVLSYDDIHFFTDGIISNDNITYGNVAGIYYTGGETKYGTHVGMSLKQVEEILGSPDHTYTAQSSELYGDNHLIARYIKGEYTVKFEVDNESEKVQSISIWREKE